MKLTEENIKFLKANLTPKDLIDLVAMKSRMNTRKKKAGNVNESYVGGQGDIYREPITLNGFRFFFNEYLNENEKETTYRIFSRFRKLAGTNEKFAEIVYDEFLKFLSNIDKNIISNAH